MAVNINVPSQVKTYANLAAFPATGALKTIYIAEDTNKTYRWTGSVYTEISASAAMTWGAIGGTLSNQTDLQSALDAKQDDITLTTTGSSGASTLVGSTLNVPNYTLSGLGGVPTSRTLTINGVTQDLSANRTFTISTGITIGSTAIASGTVGRILFEGAGNVVQESSSLFWDATNNRLGIGTSSPSNPLHLLSATNAAFFAKVQNTNGGSSATTGYEMQSNSAYGSIFATSNTYTPFGVLGPSQIGFYTTNTFAIALDSSSADFRIGAGTAAPERFRIVGSTGNVLINTTTDAGFRLDVNGTARVQGLTTLAGTMTASGAIARNGLINGTLVAAANNDVLVGLDINPTFTNGAFTGVDNFSLRITSGKGVVGTTSNAGAFPLIVRQNNYSGLLVQNSFTGTNHNSSYDGFAFWTNNDTSFAKSLITNWDNNGIYIYNAGTSSTGLILFGTTNNVGINTTTDAGFRLDVNGTARINGDNTIIGLSSVNQLSFRLGVVSNQGVSTRNGDFTIGLSGATSIDGGRFYNNGTGIFWIDGFTEGASKAQNYPIVIGSRGSATGSSVGSYTTQENGSQTYFGFYAAQPSAQVIINSTTRGFLPPRMTTTQKNAIASPAAGLMVYDTTLNVISYYNGSMWI